jgi:RNA polymerase sigma-70 factor (ECF subfamily)
MSQARSPLASHDERRTMARILPFPRSSQGRPASMSSVADLMPANPADPARDDGARWGEWMAQAQAGDRAAYHALLSAIAPYLRAIARKYLRQEQDAEDMVQEILIIVHDIRHTYEPERPFKPWLATIATRRCIDSLRRRMRRNLHELADEELLARAPDESEAASPEARLQREQEQREVRRAVGALPKRQREALQLLRFEDMSLEEAAQASEQSVGSLKVACHRAIKALHRAMNGKERSHD